MGCLTGHLQTNFSQKHIKNYNKRYNAFIIAVQEPPVRNNKVMGFVRNHKLFYDQSACSPRAALYVAKNINVWLIPEFTSGDITTCIWRKDSGEELYLVSVYMDILDQNVILPQLKSLLRMAHIKKKEVLIMADTNAHSSLWGCKETNRRGEILEDFIFSNNLRIQNKGDHFTFFNRRCATIIDVTLSTPGIDDEINDWRVTNDVQGSDHLLITWSFTISFKTNNKFRNWKLGDWSLFQRHLEEQTPATPTNWSIPTVDKEAEHLKRTILEALDKSHPPKEVRHKTQPKWWNKDLSEMHKNVKRAFSLFRLFRTDGTHNALISARRTLSHAIRKAKRNDWKNLCTDVVDQKGASILNKIIRRKENRALGILNKDGQSCDTIEASMNFLLDTHFPQSLDEEEKERTKEAGRSCDIKNTIADFITVNKVKVALSTFGDHKAPGPDGIPPIVLKNLSNRSLVRLTNIYKASWLLGYIPREWTTAKVIFIPKEGKKDYTTPRAFRPITLSTFLIKGMERLILWHLNDTVLKDNPLSGNQHAFRKGKSTETCLSNMVEYIENALIQGKVALGVFLDIQGAFDNVKPQSIIKGMEAKGVDKPTITWYYHYLLNRKILVDHEGIKMRRFLTLGTPQGGVLSPLMWNLVFESLLAEFDEGFVKICGFADDAGLITVGSNTSVLHSRMQKAIDKALLWGERAGLCFSPPKTISVLFHRKRKLDTPRTLKMSGEEIPYSKTVRYLGVTLDDQLTWKPHVRQKIQAAKGHLLKLKNAMGKLWGTAPKLTRWLFTGIVRPALTYGALVWCSVCKDKTIINELMKLNRLALISLGHLRHSTPTAGLEVINHVMPLHRWIMHEAVAAYVRTQGNNIISEGSMFTDNKSRKGHRQISREYLQDLGVTEIQSDFIPHVRVWDKYYKVNINSFEKGSPPVSHRNINIYTDGSNVDNSTGSGVVIFEENQEIETSSFHLGKQFSVFQGEIFAIFKAGTSLLDHHLKYKIIDIYVDSQAALKALASHVVSSELVSKTIDTLNEIGKNNSVTLHWIKAHVGHPGNEAADKAAKNGAQDRSLISGDLPNAPMTMVKNLLKDASLQKWDEYWQAQTECRQTKQWFPSTDKHKSHKILNLSRFLYSHMVQIITGHNFMKRHESLVQDTDDSECRLCLEEEETSYHIFAECPALARTRLMVLGTIRWANLQDLSVRQITSFFREASIGDLNGLDLK